VLLVLQGKKDENKSIWKEKELTMLEKEDRCLACGKPVQERIYAVYQSNRATKPDEEENVTGFLCEVCSKKHKMKPIRGKNPFAKLEKMKAMLKE
jgi:hypothetical protein